MAVDGGQPASMISEDEPKSSGVQVVLNLTSTEEMQAKIDAADLAARQAIYEKNLLAHQLEADSRERMRLQAGLKELALQHKRVVRAAMAAELEASGLRQQAADAAAAASTAQAQAVQAVQAAQQQLALLQAQQQQLLQSQQSILGGQGLMQRGFVGGQATPYIGADGKIVSMPMQPPFTKASFTSDQGLGAHPFMLGTMGGGLPPMGNASNTPRESNADLTEGLFDDLDLGGPHGSYHSQPGAPNLFAPEVYTYPYGPGYGSSRKRLSTSSAPGSSVPMPSPPCTRRDQQGAPQQTGGRTAGPRRTVDLANLPDMESVRAQGAAAAAAAGEASQAAAAAAAAKGAAARAGEAVAEEPQSVRMEPNMAARAATQAAKGTMIGASNRLAAVRADDTAPASTTAESNTTHGELSTTQLADHAPSEVEGATDEGATTAATEEGTEDTISTTTVFPDGTTRPSLEKQARGESSRPSTPPHSAIDEAPELEAATQPQDGQPDLGPACQARGQIAGEGPVIREADGKRRPVTSQPCEVASFPGGRTSIDNALSEVQEAMGHMYHTQSDSLLARHGMLHAPSMQNLPMVPSVPSAPDLREKDDSTPSEIYLPMIGGAKGLSESSTPSIGMGGDHVSKEPVSSEPMPLRDQLLKLSTCNVIGEGTTRSSKYGGSPPSSTPANALVGSPGMGTWGGAPQVSPGGMRKVSSDGKALAASQLLSHPPFAPSKQQLTSDSSASKPQQGSLAAELQSAGSLAQGLVGVAGEVPAPANPPPQPRTSAPPAVRTDSPFLNCKSFSLREYPATEAGVLSPTRSGTMSPPTPFSPPSSFSYNYGIPPLPHTSSAQLMPQTQQQAALQSSRSWQQQSGAGQLPRTSLVGTGGPIPMQQSYQEPPLHGLPPGPALPVRPTSRSSLTGVRQPDAAASASQMRGVRSGSVSPGAYAAYAGVGAGVDGGMAGRYSTLVGGPPKTWGANRPPLRSGISTPLSTSALSMSRGRSGVMSPGGVGMGHPLMAAQRASQRKLDEDLHLLQALDKITRERRNEINAEMESMQLEDDTLSSHNAVTGYERGTAQPSTTEAGRVKKLQEELNHAKAEASRAEAERAEAMRTRHEVAVHFQNVLAQQQKHAPGDQQGRTEGEAGGMQGDVCAVIQDDAMRQRCRDLLSDILGTTSEEQQVPPAYMVAPAAPVAPIHVQQQMSSMQAMLSQMEKVVGRLNESLEREEASRQEKEAMNRRLQALENMVMKK